MTGRRVGKGGGEERNKAILSGFSCDWWGEMLKCLSSLFLSSALQSALILTSSPLAQKHPPKNHRLTQILL